MTALSKLRDPTLPTGHELLAGRPEKSLPKLVDLIDEQLTALLIEENEEARTHLTPIVNGLKGMYHRIELARLVHKRASDKSIRRLADAPIWVIAQKLNYARNRTPGIAL